MNQQQSRGRQNVSTSHKLVVNRLGHETTIIAKTYHFSVEPGHPYPQQTWWAAVVQPVWPHLSAELCPLMECIHASPYGPIFFAAHVTTKGGQQSFKRDVGKDGRLPENGHLCCKKSAG